MKKITNTCCVANGIRLVVIGCLLALIMPFVTGCGSAQMVKLTFDGEGNVTSMSRVKYNVYGSRKLKGASVNIEKGTITIDKQSADSGKLGELLGNAGKLMIKTGELIAAGGVGGAVVK